MAKHDDEMVVMTVDEVATELRVSKMTVYRLLNEKLLPGYRVGRSFRVERSALLKYLEDNKTV